MVGNKTVSDDVPTACTNGRDETYGRAFVDSMTDAELRFVILHECYHKMYRHLITWKHLHDKNHQLANASCDYNINGKLVDENREDGFATMPRDENGDQIGLYDERFRKPDGSWSDTAMIFKTLDDDDDDDDDGGDDEGGDQGFDEHDWEGADKLSDDEVKELEKEIDVAIRQGSIIAGKSGATGNRLLGELMQPQVDWREVLREFIQTTCTGNDYSTWKRPNRRYIGAGVYMPSGISEKVDELVIAVDTSGSIPDADLAVFLSEVQSICTTVKPDKVRLLYWGHEVVGDESYATHELDTLAQSTKPRGGGGTDVECVVEYMQQHQIKPQATIILTDGYLFGDWGTWDCPTLWCVIDNKHATPDNGKVVHIDSAEIH
jgi:predicted metal-dependent peptidase